MSELIQEKEVEIDGQKFIISNFKAFIGIEIFTQLSANAVPYVGNYRECERLQIEALKHAAIITSDGKKIIFNTKEQIESHISPATTVFLLAQILKYNSENFPVASLLEPLVQEVKTRLAQSMPTFTRFLQRLLKNG